MEANKISSTHPAQPVESPKTGATPSGGTSFQSLMEAYPVGKYNYDPVTATPADIIPYQRAASSETCQTSGPSKQVVVEAYSKTKPPPSTDSGTTLSDLEKYKDDQLLSNPGGDHYDLKNKAMIDPSKEQKSFWGRLAKDIGDAASNIKNFFSDFLFGSERCYRDKNNQIQVVKQRGVVGSVIDFFKDMASALSFGAYRPDGEEAPQGFGQRALFFVKKIKEAVFGDLVEGVGNSMVHMGEDLLFAGWNLAETIPDATIGNFEAGRKATTALFDNGQVVMDYVTDVFPTGDAWIRVHSADLGKKQFPYMHNWEQPEINENDKRWKMVRNTKFRKTIETVGSIISDIVTFITLGQFNLFSEHKK